MITVVPLDRNRNDWSRLYARQYSAESGTAIDPASVLTTPRPRWAAYATAPLDRAPLVGSLVGVAQTNPDRDATFVRLYVRDDARRLGAGLALFDVVRATAAPPKLRSVVLADGPGARFAERLGASVAMHLVVMTLRFDADRAIRPMPPGYKLVTWSDAAPAELLDSYAAAKSHIADAPGVAHQLDPDWTPARIRAWEASRSVFVAAAVRDGVVVGFTELEMLPLGLSQLDTVVLPEHRGRGLALAVKSAAADLVHHEHPDLDVISSTISADNKAMLATSRRLGWMETHRRLLVELG